MESSEKMTNLLNIEGNLIEPSEMEKINADLANANEVILITEVDGTEKVNLRIKMEKEYKNLDENYEILTAEKKLFLFAITLNLMLDAHLTKNDKEYIYQDNIEERYYPELDKLPLTPLQKIKWYVEFAKVYSLTKNYRQACDCYKNAIDESKLFLKTDNNVLVARNMLMNLYADLADVNFKRAIYFENEGSAPDVAYNAYEEVLKAVENAALLNKSSPILMELRITEAKTLARLIELDSKRNPEMAIQRCNYAFETIESVKNEKFLKKQARFLLKLTFPYKTLSRLIDSSENKENINPNVYTSDEKTSDQLQRLVEKLSTGMSRGGDELRFWKVPSPVIGKRMNTSRDTLTNTTKTPVL